MTRRPRRTPAVAAAWSAGAIVLAADAAAIGVLAAHSRSISGLMATVALAYIAMLALGQALAYGCSLAWHAARARRRTDRGARPPSQRPAYTPEQLAQHRDYAQADVLAYARRHAAPDAPVRDGLTQPMPDVTRAAWSGVVADPSSLPWTAPVAGSVGRAS
jgi:hypothetical protein